MASIGIRDLKNHLSELVPPGPGASGGRAGYQRLVESGVVRPALEPGDPLADLPALDLPPGL